MRGLIQEHPLVVGTLLPFAEAQFGDVEVVSAADAGGTVRLTYAAVAGRVRRLASALARRGLGPGDMVTTLAWNTHRQLELFHATAMMGVVLHTANPRLPPEQLAYTIDHAGSRLLFCDLDGLALAETIADRLPAIAATVVLCAAAAMPRHTRLPEPACYETLIAGGDDGFAPPPPDERDAAYLCYTSGTTGRPKGALYSHRGCVLSAMSLVQPNGWCLGAHDTVLAVPPLFHCVGWGLPFMAPLVGAKLVLPGRDLDPARLVRLVEAEGVTFSMGVPTIWQGVLDHLARAGRTAPTLRRLGVGGTAPPLALVEAFRDRHGVQVIPAWGMTETTTGCTAAIPLPADPPERVAALMSGQGRAVFGVELRLVDDAGAPLPRDGRAIGHIQARGHWVASAYYKGEDGTAVDDDGWLATGDIGTIDRQGFMHITDRAKDAIKSGGEWISSIALENLAMGHPDVAEAGAVGVAHAKWGERPVLAVVRRPGGAVDADGVLAWLRPRVPKWWLPDAVLFVDALPRTATGKIRKAELREQVTRAERAEL